MRLTLFLFDLTCSSILEYSHVNHILFASWNSFGTHILKAFPFWQAQSHHFSCIAGASNCGIPPWQRLPANYKGIKDERIVFSCNGEECTKKARTKVGASLPTSVWNNHIVYHCNGHPLATVNTILIWFFHDLLPATRDERAFRTMQTRTLRLPSMKTWNWKRRRQNHRYPRRSFARKLSGI
jgi:hypothetical protein